MGVNIDGRWRVKERSYQSRASMSFVYDPSRCPDCTKVRFAERRQPLAFGKAGSFLDLANKHQSIANFWTAYHDHDLLRVDPNPESPGGSLVSLYLNRNGTVGHQS
jgi:hypothetical protein